MNNSESVSHEPILFTPRQLVVAAFDVANMAVRASHPTLRKLHEDQARALAEEAVEIELTGYACSL